MVASAAMVAVLAMVAMTVAMTAEGAVMTVEAVEAVVVMVAEEGGTIPTMHHDWPCCLFESPVESLVSENDRSKGIFGHF